MSSSKRKAQKDAVAPKHVLVLYVAGPHPQSLKALANIRRILMDFKTSYELKVIDIYDHPAQARDDQIFAAPTLVKRSPAPVKKFIGDLSNKQKLLQGLGLHADAE